MAPCDLRERNHQISIRDIGVASNGDDTYSDAQSHDGSFVLFCPFLSHIQVSQCLLVRRVLRIEGWERSSSVTYINSDNVSHPYLFEFLNCAFKFH